ncbi:MAG: diguanylate cyclase, partial [Halomonas sp.]|nr:diguanylate cyclase [Halomonas sp.]
MRLPRFRIRNQLIIGIALIHAILMSLFILDLVHKQRAFLLSQSHETAAAMAKILAANATSWTLARDFVGLEEVIDAQRHFPGLEFAMVLDNDGKVLGYTDSRVVGEYVTDSVSRSLLEEGASPSATLVDNERWIDVATRITAGGQPVGWARVRLDREPLNRSLAALTLEGIAYTLLAVLVGGVIAWWIGTSLTTRLRALIEATRSVGEGHRQLRLVDRREDELGELNRQFSSMLEALDSRERELHEAREHVQITLESMGEGVITVDAEGRVTYVNPVAERHTGWTNTEAQALPIEVLYQTLFEDGLAPRDNPVRACLEHGNRVSGQNLLLKDRSEDLRPIEDTVAPMYGRDGHLDGAVVIFRDAEEARDLQRQLSWQAYHDPLTRLYNRTAFEAKLAERVRHQRTHRGEDTLLFLDLDQFKLVNDTIGHQAGDALLERVSRTIGDLLREHDFFARLGGDEFAIILPDTRPAVATSVANKIVKALEEMVFTWDDNAFSVTASMGLTQIDAEGTPGLVLSRADVAMYMAKDSGRNGWRIYETDGGTEDSTPALDWIGEIRQAFRDDRLELFLQPIHGLQSSDQPRLAEILVRMRRKDGQLVPPHRFIPAAERYSLIDEMDLIVLRQVIDWIETAVPPYDRVDVNVSGFSLESGRFMEQVVELLEAHPEIGRRLCFEITETAAIRHLEPALDFLHQVKRFGCQLSLDDFGSGFASFQQLKHLPVD